MGLLVFFTFTDLLITGAVLLLVSYIGLTWNHDFFKKKNLPHLKPRLILGNMGPSVFRQTSLADLSNYFYKSFEGRRMGGLFVFKKPVIMIRDPELLKLVAVKDFEHFTNHYNPIPEEADPLFAANLFSRKGQKWRHMRNTLSPAFTSSKMKAMFILISKCGQQIVDYVEEKIKESGEKMIPFEMKDLFTRYTNDVIATCAFGIDCDSLKNQNNKFYTTGKELTDFGGIRSLIFFGFMMSSKLMTWLKFRFLNKEASDFLVDLVTDTIKMREKQNIVRPDMINLLMQARKGELNDSKNNVANGVANGISNEKSEKSVAVLSDMDIAGQAMVFFLAGFDTASTLLCFSSLLIAMHPEVQTRLQEEIDQTLEENGGKITYEALHAMKYLDMVVSESLRLYPPVSVVDRECTKPYTIPASDDHPAVSLELDDRIWIPIYGIHRDAKYYPDPEKFDPERFNDDNKQSINPFTYMPFGLGPRTCIGNRLALMEDKVVLVALLSKFTFEVIDRSPIPIKLTTKGFNMTVDNGFWMGLRLRNNVK